MEHWQKTKRIFCAVVVVVVVFDAVVVAFDAVVVDLCFYATRELW